MVVCTASTLPKEGGRRTVVRSKPRQILGTGTCFFVLCLLLIFSPTPTLSCSGKIDLVFCLDGSGSVNSGNWNLQSDFVKSFVDTFSGNTGDTSCSGLTCGNFDGEKGLKVGIVIYGDDSAVAITLSNDYQAIKQASVNRIETGGTGTGKCLTMAQQMLHDPTKGARGTDAAKILVLMSDGVATDATDGPSKSAKQGGTRLIAIGVATGGAHTIFFGTFSLTTVPSRLFLPRFLSSFCCCPFGSIFSSLQQRRLYGIGHGVHTGLRLHRVGRKMFRWAVLFTRRHFQRPFQRSHANHRTGVSRRLHG
jgi:uncharacterized protein YegL